MPIAELRQGLQIIQGKNATAPVIANPYIITVPAVLKSALNPTEQSTIEGLGWVEHPVYGSYYYPAKTITEVADVTGENATEIPVVDPVIPPMPDTQ